MDRAGIHHARKVVAHEWPMILFPLIWLYVLTAMLVMTFGFWMYSIAVILSRSRCVILEREQLLSWNKSASIPEPVEAR